MVTKEQIEQQILLEREAIKHGLTKLKKSTDKVESRNSSSLTVYGVTSINALMPLVTDSIEETFEKHIKHGHAGKAYKEIHQHLSQAKPDLLAAVTCKILFDHVFSYKEKANTAASIMMAIGRAVEQELQLSYYEETAPGLFKVLADRYWHQAQGTQQKFATMSLMMRRCEVEWTRWSPNVKAKLGTFLMERVFENCDWFEKRYDRLRYKTPLMIVPSAELLDIKDKVMAEAAMFARSDWPMIIPPKDWKQDEPGGYLLNECMAGHQMIRKSKCYLLTGETPIQFLNKIQRVPYRLNPFIVEIAEHLQEQGQSVGKFIPVMDHPLPNKPYDIATNEEARQTYRRGCAEVLNRNANAFRRSVRTRMTMELVQRFKNIDKFYHPWSFDYRGRAYPIPALLSVQDTDFGKSLLSFAESSVMDTTACDWLSFQVATTYGLDKASIDERLAWTADNFTLITAVATDPIGNLPEWEAADEPWQFLAACEEFYSCVIAKTRKTTCLPVATDATCSGLQILAGLAKDASTAALVNVLPGDRPSDAYKAVAEAAKPHCPESVQPHLDRKVVKRVVMTVPYNAKTKSNRDYIKLGLKEKGVEISNEDLTATVKAVREAMQRIVPGPLAVMDWINSEVRAYFKQGHDQLQWTTPSGFVVNQTLMKPNIQLTRTKLFGTAATIKYDDGEGAEVDKNHHANATAPNLIHSLDASLLHLSVTRFDAPIGVIHDSVLCRATDMSILSELLRETYMFLFAENNFLQDFAEQIGTSNPPPIIGDLEPESVIHSTYFFC